MKMRKILSLFVSLALAGSMTACGSPDSNGNSSEGTSADPKTEQSGNLQEEPDASPAVQGEKDLYGYAEPVTIKIGLSYAADFSYVEGESATENNWARLYREHNIIPEILYEVDSTQGETKMSTAIMSGNYPDVFGASTSDFVNYAQTDVVADITEDRKSVV